MSNTALWDDLKRVPPEHLKNFKRAGGFTGSAIKPMWSFHKMTEKFGPCGVGWGVGAPVFQVVTGPEGEVLVYCTAAVWHGSPEHVVYGVGGDKAVGKNKYGLASDDEAFKKAFTDAITNALKMIGVGADVHMGLFDGSKYVDEEADKAAPQSPPEPSPMSAKAREYARDIQGCTTVSELDAWAKSTRSEMDKLPAEEVETLRKAWTARKAAITTAMKDAA